MYDTKIGHKIVTKKFTKNRLPSDSPCREQRRRHRTRTKKRTPTSGDSANGDGLLKKTKVVGADVESESESMSRADDQEPQGPGRRHSFSRISTGRRRQ